MKRKGRCQHGRTLAQGCADCMRPALEAHKVMTPEEYQAAPIKGWHMVYRDFDGAGAIGVRYIADGAASLSQDERNGP